jgi:hypothetical protein
MNEDKIEALKAKIWQNTLDPRYDKTVREVMAKEGFTCTLEEFEKMKKELNDLESKLVAAEGRV